jgi:uncharacterized iron-regulated membrane protein
VPLLRVVHRWTGLALALVLGVVGLSGALLLAKGPYYRAQCPSLAAPLDPAARQGYARVLEALPTHFPGVAITLVKFPQPGMNAFQVWLADGREAFVDPVDGRVIDEWPWAGSVPAFLFELHAHLLGEDAGSVVNGIAALGGLFLGLSGLILWWPRRRQAFRLRGAVLRGWTPGALLRSHAAAGALAALPVVGFTATGAAIVFYDPLDAVMQRLFDARPVETPTARPAPPRPVAVRWPAVLATLDATLPDGPAVFYYPASARNGALTFRKRLDGEWHPNGRSYVLIDPQDGRLLQAIDARAQGAGSRAMYAVYPLHAATVGGPAVVLAAAIAGLGLAWLAVSGVASWATVRLSRTAVGTGWAGAREGGTR